MRFKKIVLGAVSVLALGALAGCSDNRVHYDWDLKDPGTLKEGFIDLANKNANSPLRADGKYVAGGKEFSMKDTFRTTYATEPRDDFYNYLCNGWTYSSEHYCNSVDGLVENDKYGNIVGAIALGYHVVDNDDGTQSWTFQLRENAEWVDNKTGTFIDYVKAQDFVTGIKYVLDPIHGSSTAEMVTNFLDGAEDYYDAMSDYEDGLITEAPDFADVGVKAIDDFTLEYTTASPMPYFITVLTYSPYLPVRAAFLEEIGSDFGATPNDIEVNGAFRITGHEFESKFEYSKNIHYYDRDHVYVNNIEKIYVPGTATAATTREWFEGDVIDSFSVRAKDQEGWKKYVTGEDGSGTLKNPYSEICNSVQSYGSTTYTGYWNFNRSDFAYNDSANVKTDAQKRATAAAVLNKHFRVGFLYGLDVLQNLKYYDENEPYNYLMRGYTNYELASAEGRDYTEYFNDVFNEKQGTTGKNVIGIDNGSDPVFSVSKAAAEFALAKSELIAAGWCSESDFPIKVDVVIDRSNDYNIFQRAMYASFDDASLAPYVDVQLNLPNSDQQEQEWSISMASSGNYDFSMASGWGPDYADPNTYMHTMCIGGDLLIYNGLHPVFPVSSYLPTAGVTLDSVDAIAELVLSEYDALYRVAAAVTDPAKTKERFEKFAVAEYNLIYESGLIVPWLAANGYAASVAKTVPWQAGRAGYGLQADKLKNVVVTDSAMTKADRKAVTDEYNAGK